MLHSAVSARFVPLATNQAQMPSGVDRSTPNPSGARGVECLRAIGDSGFDRPSDTHGAGGIHESYVERYRQSAVH